MVGENTSVIRKIISKNIDARRTQWIIMWPQHRGKENQKWEWSHWLGPWHGGLVDFILLAVGFCRQILGLVITRLEFILEMSPCPECEGWCGKCEEHCRWQKNQKTVWRLSSNPGKISWLPEYGELQWRGWEMNAFDRGLGDKRDGTCGLEAECEREDPV